MKGIKSIKIGMISLLIVVLIIPTSVFVNASDVSESNKIVNTAGKYLSLNEDTGPTYNRDQAIKDGVSKEVLEVADEAYRLMSEQFRYDTTGIQARWPIYGNWCGPKYGSGTPIDLLDAGCRTHDKCYGSRGYHKCSCDKDFRAYINRNISKMSGTQKIMANAMKVWLNKKISKVTSKGGAFSCRK